MPWQIETDHPDCDGFAVVKTEDGTVDGCHTSHADAEEQLAALYANERSAMTSDIPLKKRIGSVRMVSQLETRAEANGRRTLRGVFTPFNSWTLIDSWEGRFWERAMRGAFKRTIQHSWDAHKRTGRHAIIVNYNHGFDGAIGSKQLGPIRVLEERGEGPYYEVALLDTEYNREYIIPAAEEGLLGASYRFAVPKDGEVVDETGPNGDEPHRSIVEASVFEFGPVDHPAYEAASAGIRTSEEFQWWMNLDEEGRTDLARLIRQAHALGTSIDMIEPAAEDSELVPEDTSAPDSPPEEAPVSESHPEVRRRKYADGLIEKVTPVLAAVGLDDD